MRFARIPVIVLAAAAGRTALADPSVTEARIERRRTGIRATVRGTISAEDWGASTAADVRVGSGETTLAAPGLRFDAHRGRWSWKGASGDAIRRLTCDLRKGEFTLKARTADPADYADPLAFDLAPGTPWRFEVPVVEDRRVTVFHGSLAPLQDDPGGGGGGGGSGGGGGGGGGGGPPEAKRLIGYFTSWGVYARGYHVKHADLSGAAARLSHVNYAFANIGPDLRVTLGDPYADIDRFYPADLSVDGAADTWDAGALRGSFHQFAKLKAKYPELKVLASIGGWTWSGRFSDAALTPESRAAFVESAIDLFIRGKFAPGITRAGIFDGIDLDWEWPGAAGETANFRPEDGANYTALLAAFRSALDAEGALDGRTYLLTIAAPAGASYIAKFDIAGMAPLVDGVNLMAYDFRGGWDARTGHHSPLHQPTGEPSPADGFWTDHAVGLWLAGGLPAEKLSVGVPFYGRGWTGVAPGPSGTGMWQTATGPAPGTWESGVDDWEVLDALPSSFVRRRDPASGAVWLFDSAAGIFWSYDDAQSLAEKAAYVRAEGLGGAMVWELSGDDGSGTLIDALADALAAPAK